MKQKYVLIDCDPGHDDVMAILSTIAHPDIFHILGITKVCGNNLVSLITENMLNVLHYIHREDIPVCMVPKIHSCIHHPHKLHMDIMA